MAGKKGRSGGSRPGAGSKPKMLDQDFAKRLAEFAERVGSELGVDLEERIVRDAFGRVCGACEGAGHVGQDTCDACKGSGYSGDARVMMQARKLFSEARMVRASRVERHTYEHAGPVVIPEREADPSSETDDVH